jgi:uncharacterized protein YcbK (DUF882 family)
MNVKPGLLCRRSVLGGLLAAPFVIRPAEAVGRARGLVMNHLHTCESLSATYWRNGSYDKVACSELNHFLRDWRTNDVIGIDLRALDIIHSVCDRLGASGGVEIISGYRSPKTNAMLRGKTGGVAKKSYHLKGQAIDFRLPGQRLPKTYQAARSLQAGGVGIYSKSQFIHIDTGPVRSWGR